MHTLTTREISWQHNIWLSLYVVQTVDIVEDERVGESNYFVPMDKNKLG